MRYADSPSDSPSFRQQQSKQIQIHMDLQSNLKKIQVNLLPADTTSRTDKHANQAATAAMHPRASSHQNLKSQAPWRPEQQYNTAAGAGSNSTTKNTPNQGTAGNLYRQIRVNDAQRVAGREAVPTGVLLRGRSSDRRERRENER